MIRNVNHQETRKTQYHCDNLLDAEMSAQIMWYIKKKWIYIRVYFRITPKYRNFLKKLIVTLKSSIFCNIIPCSPLKVNRRFGGTRHLHLQSRRMSQARNQHETTAPASCWFLAYYSALNIEMTYSSETSVDFHWTTRRYIPEARLFIITAVRTSNPDCYLVRNKFPALREHDGSWTY
jgi:hypothetical protein